MNALLLTLGWGAVVLIVWLVVGTLIALVVGPAIDTDVAELGDVDGELVLR